MKLIPRIKDFKPIVGDDLPNFSMRLRDVPNGFHITDIEINQTTHPRTYEIKDRLLGLTEQYYRNFEVNGITLQDFKENIQLSYDINSDVFEKILSYYPTLDILVGNNVYENVITETDKKGSKDSNDISNEKSSNIGNVESSKNKSKSDSKVNNIVELNDSKNENITSSVNLSTENKVSDTTINENGDNNENSDIVNMENENNKGIRNNIKNESNLQSENENTRNSETNESSRNFTKNDEIKKNSTDNKNHEQSDIAVSLDSDNLYPHSKTIINDNNTQSDYTTDSYNEYESSDGETINQNDRNRSLSSDVNGSENENIENEIARTKTEQNNKNSEFTKKSISNGTDTITYDENGNIIDSNDLIENRKKTENENVNGFEMESTFNKDSSERQTDSISTGMENTTEKQTHSENRTKYTDRVGNEQMIDIFDNFIKKYPNIIKIFISYFKDDFVIYESGYF